MCMKDYVVIKLKGELPDYALEINRDASIKGWELLIEAPSKKDPLSKLMLGDCASIELFDYHFPTILKLVKKVTGKLGTPLSIYLGIRPQNEELFVHRGLENPFWIFG